MKLTINSKTLLNALNKVNSVVEKRNTIPILNNVYVKAESDHLYIQGTDLDITVKTHVADADIIANGEFTASAVMISDIVKRLPDGDVTLEYKDDILHIRAGRSKFKMQTLPVQDFPKPQEPVTLHDFTVTGSDLKSWLDKVAFAASTDETRYYLGGVYLHVQDQKVRLVSTDGHRLAMQTTTATCHANNGIIIPRKTVAEIIKLCEHDNVHVSFSDSIIVVSNNDTTLISKLIEGTFPQYERILPTNNNLKMIVDAETIKKASDRVASINDQRTRAVRIVCRQGEVELSVRASNGDDANETIDAECSFDLETGVNSRYLADAMNRIDGDVEIAFADGNTPMVARQVGDDSYLTLIMPMRV